MTADPNPPSSTPVKTNLRTPPDPGQADLPHERDESVGMTGGVQDPVIQQAHADVERGLQDTSRSNESDAAYRKLKK